MEFYVLEVSYLKIFFGRALRATGQATRALRARLRQALPQVFQPGKEADIEMGATIYRRTRAERWGESHKLAPTPLPTPALRGGGHLHPLRGVGEGTDGLRVGPRQLARTSSEPYS